MRAGSIESIVGSIEPKFDRSNQNLDRSKLCLNAQNDLNAHAFPYLVPSNVYEPQKQYLDFARIKMQDRNEGGIGF